MDAETSATTEAATADVVVAAKAEPKPKKERPVEPSSAVHTALDKADKALTIAERVEARQRKALGEDETPAAPGEKPKPKSAWSQFVSGLKFDDLDDDAPDGEE